MECRCSPPPGLASPAARPATACAGSSLSPHMQQSPRQSSADPNRALPELATVDRPPLESGQRSYCGIRRSPSP
eukprot:13886186-Heterocapsa_arctica.AAC.1